jgi:hypothetical protein
VLTAWKRYSTRKFIEAWPSRAPKNPASRRAKLKRTGSARRRYFVGGADRRFDHGRMLAHAEMIVRIPNWF